MSVHLSKTEVKRPDEFLTILNKLYKWHLDNAKLVIIAISIIAIGGVSLVVKAVSDESREQKLQAEFALIEKAYLETKTRFAEAENNTPSKDKNSKANNDQKNITETKVKASGDIEKDYGSTIKGLQDLITKSEKTKASFMSYVLLSSIYLDYKKYDEAKTLLETAIKKVPNDSVFNVLLSNLMGNVYANTKQCDQAISTWKQVLDSKVHTFAHDESKLRMGLCYTQLGQKDKAEQLFNEISLSSDTASNEIKADARKYLQFLKAEKNWIN